MAKNPATHYDDMPHRGLTEEAYLTCLNVLENGGGRLEPLLQDLHPADIADLIERLPRHHRSKLLEFIPAEHVGDVINELEEGVKEHVLQLLEVDEVRDALVDLESDDAAHIARTVEEIGDESGPDAVELLSDHQQKRLLNYDPDSAGGIMQVEVVTASPSHTVSQTLEYLRDNEDDLPTKPGTVFVVDDHRHLVGTVSLSRLVRMPLTAALRDIMRREPLTVHPEEKQQNVVKMFEKYDIHNLAVVNSKNQLLGRITIDDVLDVVLSDNARTQARSAGLDETEDLFSPTLETTRHRLPWLIINLGTAVLAASVIAMFEASIAKLTTLAVLMPIVASMGGNATTQTQTVIIRGLALGQITRQNAWELLRKEFMVGGYVGTILALAMALGAWLLYGNPMLALVIALATVANHAIAAFAGWMTPLILRRYNYDPAISTGVITTTFTDVGGFFVFLGLATLLLL